MIYGNKIKHIRERNNIKEKQIAEILNISRSLYCDYEKENKTIPTKHLNTICNYLNVSFDYIFNFENTKQYRKCHKTEKLDLNIIRKRLKELRKDHKITQEELGKIAGCSYGTIAGYEIGRYLISIPVLYKICRKYNISAEYLLGRIEINKKIS